MPQSPTRMQPQCVARGALSVILRISQVFGLAPVKISPQKRGDGFDVTYSPVVAVYGLLVILVLNLAVVISTSIDLCLEGPRAVNTRSTTTSFAWVAAATGTALVVTTAVGGAPARVRALIHYFNILEQVQVIINNSNKTKIQDKKAPEGQRSVFIIAILCSVLVNQIFLISVTFPALIEEGREWRVFLISWSHNVQSFMVVVTELQFVVVALHVHDALRRINDSFNHIVCVFDLYSMHAPAQGKTNDIVAKTVNYVIDAKSDDASQRESTKASNIAKTAEETVRRLVLSFSVVCDVIHGVNQNFGRILIFLMAFFFIHLIITPYYIVALIYRRRSSILNILVQVMFLVLHTVYLLIAVEPGHRTEQEFERTSKLLSKLLRLVRPRSGLAAELDVYYKMVHLNKASYTPLGISRLTRPLTAAMYSGVTTYLVIILQFQALESDAA